MKKEKIIHHLTTTLRTLNFTKDSDFDEYLSKDEFNFELIKRDWKDPKKIKINIKIEEMWDEKE
jgi:hypothetical protein